MNELDLLAEHRWRDGRGCNCGWFPDYSNTHKAAIILHADHQKSALLDHGYMIIGPSEVQALEAIRQGLDDYEAGEFGGIEYEFPGAIRTIVGKSTATEEGK